MAEFLQNLYTAFIEGDRYKLYFNGLKITMQLSLGGVIIGITLGLILAMMRLSKWKLLGVNWLSGIAGTYIDIIRGTPMVVQMLIFYFVIFGSVTSTAPSTKVMIGALAFGCNSGAYVAEIIRAGIQSIDHGQTEAGRSLGLNSIQTMRFIILPQAIKNVIPALCNELIVLVKETSIFGYIGGVDLAKVGEQVRARTFESMGSLVIIALMYYLVVKLLTILMQLIERRLRASDHR